MHPDNKKNITNEMTTWEAGSCLPKLKIITMITPSLFAGCGGGASLSGLKKMSGILFQMNLNFQGKTYQTIQETTKILVFTSTNVHINKVADLFVIYRRIDFILHYF